MAHRERVHTRRSVSLLFLLALCAFVLFTSSPASAAGIVGKDGKIHACYKAKGKGKGTLRVVRSAKARCPKKWKKVAWYARGPVAAPPGIAGPAGPQGSTGSQGERGEAGPQGLPGRNENLVINELEDKVTELLSKVQSLETILNGIGNTQLKEAIAGIVKTETLEAAVGSLCTQTEALTEKSGELGTALSGLGTVLDTLTVLALPSIPTALSPYSCP
ncbi:MAG TPA: collagen-like protein [Solirubrobacterales bacterium]|nr:collagen-like protein [Solirubrobacterales bacterium]